MVKGNGKARGSLRKNLLRSKEKIDPQAPSIHIGTIGAPALRAISSKPRLTSWRQPVRVSSPSANKHTTSPFSNESLTARTASFALVAEIGTVLKTRAPQPTRNVCINPSYITNRTGRWQAAEIKKQSAQVTWFGSNKTPPVSGMFCASTIRMR